MDERYSSDANDDSWHYAPNMHSINVRRLDDFDLESESNQTINFDGHNWEQAVAILNEQLNSNTSST